EGRLAGAARPHHGDDLALVEDDARAAQRLGRAERPVQVIADEELGHRAPPRPGRPGGTRCGRSSAGRPRGGTAGSRRATRPGWSWRRAWPSGGPSWAPGPRPVGGG